MGTEYIDMNDFHKPQTITFIIPTLGRPELLEKCLSSFYCALGALGSQELRDFSFQLKVVVNGEDSYSTRYNELSSRYPDLSISFVKRTTPGVARNIAVREKYSDYFYFIDDDTQLPPHFLYEVCNVIRLYPEVEIFGGPDQSNPDASIFERSLEFSLRSPLATSKTRWRHLSQEKRTPLKGNEKNLILCNLCVKGDVFYKKGGGFPEGYQRNEENVFLRAVEDHFQIIYLPYLFIFHKRRPALNNVFYSASQSGFFRYKMIKERFSSDQLIFFLPSIFILYLALLPLAVMAGFHVSGLIPLALYFILNIFYSLIIFIKNKNIRYFFLVSFYQLFILLSYGIGMWKSCFIEVISLLKVTDTSPQTP